MPVEICGRPGALILYLSVAIFVRPHPIRDNERLVADFCTEFCTACDCVQSYC